MLEYTQDRGGASLELLVLHEDAVREYSYGPNTRMGTLSQSIYDDANAKGWTVISMKYDWKQISAGAAR
jgi:hypothetical protein